MKTILLALLVPVLAPEEVSVTTNDGEVVQGDLRKSSFDLDTDWGSAEIDLDKIVSIQFGDPDVVVTTSYLELRGELKLSRLKIDTSSGSRTLRRADLASLVVYEDGRPRGSADFSGEWMSTFGPMELHQSGLTVDGYYGHAGESSLEGTVRDRRFEFEYGTVRGGGTGWFELEGDGRVMLGEYEDSDGDTNFWGAYRLAPEVPAVSPGEFVRGQSRSGLYFHLRVPEDYDDSDEYPAIAFFHGSNMSARSYVETIAAVWPELAADYVLVGIDGEHMSAASDPGALAFNYTYINFSGHRVGDAWRYNQSPGLVSDALVELQEALPIRHWLIGGHSQGGFLTYALAMFYPDLVAGAFPMSCNLLVQAEPSYFDEAEMRAKQREVPIAHVHGTTDDVIEYSAAEYCYEAFQDGGFPMLRLFSDESAGHLFAHLPVAEAVRWLETFASGDARRLVAFGEEQLEAGHYRDATAAALRAAELDRAGALKSRIERLHERVDAQAEPRAGELLPAIRAARNDDWVDDFWEFRRQFAFTPAAADCMEAFARLREEHEEPADELFYESRGERDPARRDAMREEIVEKYFASRWYRIVKRWLE